MLIQCNNLTLNYRKKIITQDINFHVNKGDYLCIVGENGAGKSTLIKTLLKLKQPLEGTCAFHEELKKNDIGYLPQQTVVQQDFPASVKEVVLSGFLGKCGLRPFYSKLEKEKFKEIIIKFDIHTIKNRCFRELSGGQKQRVLLARAMCATTKVLLLDEPVAGLDPIATVNMYQLIQDINADGITIIMVTHDIESALKHSSHILHIGTKQLFFGKTQDYSKNKVIERILLNDIGGELE